MLQTECQISVGSTVVYMKQQPLHIYKEGVNSKLLGQVVAITNFPWGYALLNGLIMAFCLPFKTSTGFFSLQVPAYVGYPWITPPFGI